GVVVTHRNVLRLFTAAAECFAFDRDDVWSFFHSAAFDFSVWEIWGALTHGARLAIVPYETSRDPHRFHDFLATNAVTVLSQTPSAFYQLREADRDRAPLEQLRYIVFGGEALVFAKLRRWFERYGDAQPVLVNMYGITETTVHVTWRQMRQQDCEHRGSLIGRPLRDLSLYALMANGEPCPVGVVGELFVGGAGVSQGYLDRPALQAERFVANPFGDGRLYRTGDLGRFLDSGELEFLGRADHQVKIRGFRIELGEIETALVACAGVRECLVAAVERDADDVRLVAYVVAESEARDANTLRQAIARELPDYMLPSPILFLDELPLTRNGKLDRAALPAPWPDPVAATAAGEPADSARDSSSAGTAGIAEHLAQGRIEQALTLLWKELLQIANVGLDDNFFDLGGHSLLIVRAHGRLGMVLDKPLAIADLFQFSTIRTLAAHIRGLDSRTEDLSPPQPGASLPSGNQSSPGQSDAGRGQERRKRMEQAARRRRGRKGPRS
ncbi:MAG: non-ribosomal peptide synthetase, partial [Myxococcota bacterium]